MGKIANQINEAIQDRVEVEEVEEESKIELN